MYRNQLLTLNKRFKNTFKAGIYFTIYPFIKNEKIVTFHIGRCGSTVVGNMLKQHPKIHWGGEVFEKRHQQLEPFNDRQEISSYLERIISRKPRKYFGIEIKILPDQHVSSKCLSMSIKDLVYYLKEAGFTKFIVLKRNNYLKRVCSVGVSLKNKQWHSNGRETGLNTFQLNNEAIADTGKATLIESFIIIDGVYLELNRLLKNESVLHLEYEKDIAEDPYKAYNKIIEFLGLKPGNPEIRFKKQNPYGISEILENYEQVRTQVINTPYEWMLND